MSLAVTGTYLCARMVISDCAHVHDKVLTCFFHGAHMFMAMCTRVLFIRHSCTLHSTLVYISLGHTYAWDCARICLSFGTCPYLYARMCIALSTRVLLPVLSCTWRCAHMFISLFTQAHGSGHAGLFFVHICFAFVLRVHNIVLSGTFGVYTFVHVSVLICTYQCAHTFISLYTLVVFKVHLCA